MRANRTRLYMSTNSAHRIPTIVWLCLGSGIMTAGLALLFCLSELDMLLVPPRVDVCLGFSFVTTLYLWIAIIVKRSRAELADGPWIAYAGGVLGVVLVTLGLFAFPACA